MSGWPDAPDPIITPQFIHSYSSFCPAARRGRLLINGALGIGSITWTANLAAFVPHTVPYQYPIRRVFWGNGSTLTSSNAEFAIYNANGVQIYTTGSVALSGASAPQYVTPTAFELYPGRYYFAYT
jgi:hypothetical protein